MNNKPKKVVALRFLSSESLSWVKLSCHQPLIHKKYVTIKEQPKKNNQLCILGFLVRADVYPIHLHLKNFMGTLEPYFCHAPIPGPTRLADPNRVRGARTNTRTLYLTFFFFKTELVPVVMAHIL